METAASFRIRSECSVVEDGRVLRIDHPHGDYRARIRNIPRTEYTVPFLLSLHIYFDAPSLDDAKDVAIEHLADCLNMLAFTTGTSIKLHATKSIVDVEGGAANAMTTVHLWGDTIEYEDPQPFFDENITTAIERLLKVELPPAVRRAMRWYRLGIVETVPDDQFMYFWFALEIVAEFQKSSEKVPDRCPKCDTPLYCESCQTHPVHRAYAKQAIRTLLKTVDKNCDDSTISLLEKARNSLMHGRTLKEIEVSLPEPHEAIVDVLGHLVWRSLLWQFPHEMFDGSITLGSPSTYIRRTMTPVAILETMVSTRSDGELDLDFKGFTVNIEPFGPPQSGLQKVLKLNAEQYERLTQLAFKKGDHQEMCRRIYDKSQPDDDGAACMVLSTDWDAINEAISKHEDGDWQDLFRDILHVDKG